MSREDSHWKAKDYEWNPHTLQATRSQPRGAEERPDNVTAESEATQNTETNKSEARGERTGREAASAKVGTSVELDSAADRSSRGTGSGEEGPSSRGAAPVPVVKDTLASVHGPSKKRIPLQCQVDGCHKDLSKEKEYYQRYRICEDHLKLSSLIKDGIEQRFCQQCGRFHVLADFDADKRSCRARLNLHNDRRRKRVPEQATPRQDLLNPQPRGRRTRTRRKRLPYGEQAASEELDALDAEAAAVDSSSKSAHERRKVKAEGRLEGRLEGSRMQSVLQGIHAQELRSFQPTSGYLQTLRGVPLEMPPSLFGMPGILPPLSSCLPGSVVEERYAGSSMPTFPYLMPPAGLRELSRHESDRPRLTTLRAEEVPGKARSDGSGSPAKDATTPSLRFWSGPAQDFLYEQHTQLLRDGWGDPQRQQSQLHLDTGTPSRTSFSPPSALGRRHGPDSPVAPSQRIHAGPSILAPRIMPGEGSLASRFSSDRGSSIAQLLSGGSDSSHSHFHPLNTQESAGSRQGGNRHQSGDAGGGGTRRAPPGALRVEPDNGVGRRLSSPDYPSAETAARQETPGTLGSRSDESLHRTTPALFRHSNPGSWARQYPGFHGETVRDYNQFDPERLHISRSGVKLEMTPDNIPASMRGDYLQIIGSPDAAHLEASMRPGCTHIVATTLAQEQAASDTAGVQRLLQSNAKWSKAEMLIQLPGDLLHVHDGLVTSLCTGSGCQAVQPRCPELPRRSLLAGEAIEVGLPGFQGDSGALRLLARCNGAFVADEQVLEPCVLLHAPLDAGEGILWVETELAGVLSEPRALVLTANADIAEEIQSLPESGSNQGMSEEDMDSLIVDIGMVLQYASQAQPARGHKPRSEGLSFPGGMEETCCRLADASAADFQRMSSATYLSFITTAARRVAAFCLREGWPALAAKVLPIAAIGLRSWSDLVAKLEMLLGRHLLLHAVTSSGSVSMAILVLDLCRAFGQGCSLSGSLRGTTALHIAAGLPDGGRLAKILLERCPRAKLLWTSARDSRGHAPADIAYLSVPPRHHFVPTKDQNFMHLKQAANRTNVRGGDRHERKPSLATGLGRFVEQPGTPPDTPRLGDLLLTGRIRGIDTQLPSRMRPEEPCIPEAGPAPGRVSQPTPARHCDLQ